MAMLRKLTVVRFEEHVALTDQLMANDAASPFLGLVGEVGSLLSALKKKNRDTDGFLGYHDSVVEELGDVLWYISAVARRGGTSLHEVLLRIATQESRQEELTFDGMEPSRASMAPKAFET
jgi:NTP pyrophosphatase (non-canonical NTP hydrolase)